MTGPVSIRLAEESVRGCRHAGDPVAERRVACASGRRRCVDRTETLSDARREGDMSAARVRSNVSTTRLLGIRRKAGYEGGICDAAAVTCVLVPGSVVAAGPEVTIVISKLDLVTAPSRTGGDTATPWRISWS